jgi:hypothetical protein
MQKIISLIFILSILCIKINAQTTVIDDGSFLYIQGSSIQRVHIHKDLCAVQKTADKVILTFSSNNTPFVFSWNVAQSTAYKGGLNQTYDYIVGLLNTISTSTPPPSPNAGDSLLSSKIDTLINYVKMTDTTQIDTPLVNYIFQFDRQNDTLSKIIDLLKNIKDTSNQAILEQIRLNISDSLRTSFYVNNDSIKVYVLNNYIDSTYYVLIDSIVKLLQKDTFIVKFTDSTYYTQLDSIKYYLSQNDSIEVCFDTITFNTNVVNLPIVNCNGDSAVRVQVCNIDTSINVKVDTTNSILYRIENKNITDTTHTAILREISDTLTHLAEILNELKSDCIGSNETYYINGTNSVTINASEVCSYTITVIGGDVDFSENGVSSPFSFPNGYTGSSSFKNGTKFLINQITFTGTNGSSKAIIKIIK